MAVREAGDMNINQPHHEANLLRSLTSFGAFAVPRESGSAYTTKLYENLSKIFLEKRPNIVKEIFVIDKETERDINFSCVVVTASIEGNLDQGKSFAILLLAATGNVKEEVKNVGNEQVKLAIYPSTYIDKYLVDKVLSFVSARTPNLDSKFLYNADGFVIPANFNIEDPAKLKELSKRCEQYVFAELATQANADVIDLKEVSKDTNLVIDVSTNNTPGVDSVGEPIRESFVVEFNSLTRDGRNVQQSLHNTQGQKQNICHVGGFFDLLFGPEDPSIVSANKFMKQNAPISTKRYIPRCVITSFDSVSISIPRFLIGLYTTIALQHDRNWVQFFRRKIQTGKTPAYDDVGFLNIEANISQEPPGGYGVPIDTSSFDMAELSGYMSAMVQDNLLYSLDCPDGNPETYYTRVFQEAASGNSSAMQFIYDCMDQLTSGYFSQEFSSSLPIVGQNPIKVLTGYWTDSDGNVRDIRDIDTLTVCNMVGMKNEDPAFIVDWMSLFIPEAYADEDLRLDKMRKMLNMFLQDTATYTGVATRVNFQPEALVAFMHSIEKCGITISNIVTPINSSEMTSRRQMFTYDSSVFNQQRALFRSSSMGSNPTRTFRGYSADPGRF